MIGHRSAGAADGVTRKHEDGRVLGNENDECESPAWIDLVTPW